MNGMGEAPAFLETEGERITREEQEGRSFPCPKCDGHGAVVVRIEGAVGYSKVARLCERCDGEGTLFATLDMIEDAASIGSNNPFCEHDWSYTGTAYGGDDESYHGEGRCYCAHCGADGDA